jgi:hypothetical protein
MSSAAHLTARINRNGAINDSKVPRPLLTLEEFFEGNDDHGSIGCNLIDSIHPREFFEVFRRLRDRPDVADVLVEIRSWDDPADWPFTDTVWVITSLTPEVVQQQLGERLQPDEVTLGWPSCYPVESIDVPPAMHPIRVWWD